MEANEPATMDPPPSDHELFLSLLDSFQRPLLKVCWFCALIVGLHWLFGWLTDDRINILDQLDPWWIAANYAFGVLFVPLGYLVARVLSTRCHGHRWWQAVLDDISGRSSRRRPWTSNAGGACSRPIIDGACCPRVFELLIRSRGPGRLLIER